MKKPKVGRNADEESGGRSRGPGEDGQATRDALMEAALRLLKRDGVLAGLNISEVAKEVGVTPANIYHYFKSRQGLLRAAISKRITDLTSAGPPREEPPWPQRTTEGFAFVRGAPELSLVALLALDRDDEYNLAPFLDRVRKVLDRDKRRGILDDGFDLEVMHMLLIALQYGYVMFAPGAARQLEIPFDEFEQRAMVVFERIVMAFCRPEPSPP